MIRCDLHIHTTASDGKCSPSRIVETAFEKRLNVISITDHDNASGLREGAAAAQAAGITFIPGIEISTEGDKEIHILGYGIDPDDPQISEFAENCRIDRINRCRKIAGKLEGLGLSIPIEEIIRNVGSMIGRPHLARKMVDLGYVSSVQEAFERYLSKNRPAYVPRETISAVDAIRLLLKARAFPVLAHPGLIDDFRQEGFLRFLSDCQDAGLAGMEVYHPNNRGYYEYFDRIARERNLFVTGGSDFHQNDDAHHGDLGATCDEWPTVQEDTGILLQLLK